MSQPRLMLFRFCLYGFLKNQLYYDPFLVLAFVQKGLSFGTIGVLIGFRAVCVNVMEIPAGAIADILGRRQSMIASFFAYIASFTLFGLCHQLWILFVAMSLFSVGEAFRTGTHKAMIFDWLERQGRLSERTAVYGHTRSWSKLGSAVSVIIATGLVFYTEQYSSVFLLCILPYVLGIVNLMGYPPYLDGPRQSAQQSGGVLRTAFSVVSKSIRRPALRQLLLESMGYEGLFRSSKDYIQPVIQVACVSLPVMIVLGDRLNLAEHQRVAIGVGVVYFFLHLLSSFAARGAGGFAKRFGGEDRSARVLWVVDLAIFAMIAGGILVGAPLLVIVAFVLLAIFQNFWRPILVSRVAAHADSAQTATVLSIESQAKSLFVAIIAPLLGWSIDLITSYDQNLRFLPIAGLGLLVSTAMLLISRTGPTSPRRLPRCEV